MYAMEVCLRISDDLITDLGRYLLVNGKGTCFKRERYESLVVRFRLLAMRG